MHIEPKPRTHRHPALTVVLSFALGLAGGCGDDEDEPRADSGTLSSDAGAPGDAAVAPVDAGDLSNDGGAGSGDAGSGSEDTGATAMDDAGTPAGDCLTSPEMAINSNLFFPEKVAIAADGTAYVGSLITGAVVSFDACSGAPTTLVAPTTLIRNAVGMVVDEVNDALWVCSTNAQTRMDAAIVGVSRVDGSEVGRHAFPVGPSFCNDLAFDGDGNLYATDSTGLGILRVPAASLLSNAPAESWFDDPAFDPAGPMDTTLNGIAIEGTSVYTVHTASGVLYRLSIDASGAARDLTSIPLGRQLMAPDGLAMIDARSLAVVEGGAGFMSALSRVTLEDGDRGTVDFIEAQIFNFPTTVAVFGDQAWVVNAQLDRLQTMNPELPFLVTRHPL